MIRSMVYLSITVVMVCVVLSNHMEFSHGSNYFTELLEITA